MVRDNARRAADLRADPDSWLSVVATPERSLCRPGDRSSSASPRLGDGCLMYVRSQSEYGRRVVLRVVHLGSADPSLWLARRSARSWGRAASVGTCPLGRWR